MIRPDPRARLILALDPGLSTGVCLGSPGQEPRFTTWRLPSDSRAPHVLGPAFAAFEAYLESVLPVTPKRCHFEVVVEAPFIPHGKGAFMNINALRLVLGLIAVAEKWGHDRSVPIYETGIAAHRAELLGRTKGVQKSDVSAMVKLRGLNPKNQHEGDAGSIWLHRVWHYDRSLKKDLPNGQQLALGGVAT
jgi:hypothetical protein